MYSDDWEAIAKRKKDSVGWKCEKCGHPHDTESGYMLTVHHLNARSFDNQDDNLVAVCQRCHLSMQPRAWAVRDGQIALF